MPDKLNRREFIKLSLLSLSLAACRKLPEPASPTPAVSSPTSSDQTAASATAPATSTPSPQPAAPDLPVPSFIVDGHQDIAWNALEFGRDLRQSAFEGRQQELGTPLSEMIGQRITGLPEFLAGRIGIIFATVFVLPAENAYPGYHAMTYTTSAQAEERAKAQMEYYHQLAGQEPRFRLVASKADLEAVAAGWAQPANPGDQKVGLVLLMEGADPILDPADVPEWHQAGLRMIGPAWHATRYSGGTGEPGPLSELGRRLLQAMAELNMILDLSHLAETAYLQAVADYPGPLMASHSNPRPFLPTDRGLSDEMIRKLVARDGVVGINLFNSFLKPGWQQGRSKKEVTLETVAEAIDYVAQLAGDARHVAIGSDFDGGFGVESIPAGLDSAADLLKLTPVLEKRGYSREDLEDVFNGNWLRILRDSLV